MLFAPWDVCDYGRMETIEEAEQLMEQMRENGDEIPEGMTAEDIMKEWNANVVD